MTKLIYEYYCQLAWTWGVENMKKKLEAFLREFKEDDDLQRIDVRFGSYPDYAFVFKRDHGKAECWIRNGADWLQLKDMSDFFFRIEQIEKVINDLPRIFKLYRSTCLCDILIENINWTMHKGWMIEAHSSVFCPGCGKKLPKGGLAAEIQIEIEKPDRFARIMI